MTSTTLNDKYKNYKKTEAFSILVESQNKMLSESLSLLEIFTTIKRNVDTTRVVSTSKSNCSAVCASHKQCIGSFDK